MALAQLEAYTEDDYYALPDNIRAELIDGKLYYMAAPSRIHQEILSFLHLEIGNYIRSKKGSCHVYPAPFAVKLFDDKENIVEPDISVICNPQKLTDKGCTGSPDWVIEIVSPSTSSHDYIRKLNLYSSAGMREYWIVDPMKERVYVYYLEESNFSVDTYTFHDKVKANIYDNLYIDFSEIDI